MTVLIPAHNEEAMIEKTVETVRGELAPEDRVLVIADNCDDHTARLAEAAGAQVVERRDPDNRGKGHALAHGVKVMTDSPPEVVVVLDADCVPEPGSVQALARHAVDRAAPIQGVNTGRLPASPTPLDSVSTLAFLLKNLVRPRGLSRLGLPCLLTGTGMAFPWEIIRSARLATSSIVEDLELGLDLAIHGHAPRFTEDARVWSDLPSGRTAARIQRRRWEHGHLGTIVNRAPKLLLTGVVRGRPRLIVLALELAVPPLSLLTLLLLGVGLADLVYWRVTAGGTPLVLTTIGLTVLGGSVGIAWLRFGRTLVSARSLIFAPVYALSKVGLYLGFARGREQSWRRTPRD